jgi:protein gp37
MKNTLINWAHHTMNPWRGCAKVSEACDNCYAEAHFSTKISGIEWGKGKPRRRTSQAYWKSFLSLDRKLRKLGIRKRVFCGSCCDVFDPEVEEQWRTDLFALIEGTTSLDWLLLTKRPHLALQYDFSNLPVWLGPASKTSCGTIYASSVWGAGRAKVKFLSVEPLLGPIQLELDGVKWVICGGESAQNRKQAKLIRPMDLHWARSIRDQCKAAGVAFWMKQLGGYPDKGDKLEDLPIDLRVRELP